MARETNVMIIAERRTCPRIPFRGVAIVRTGRTEIPCLAHDLSASGMLISPRNADRNPGKEFRVTFALPDTGRWLDLDARLIRKFTSQRRLAWGVKFLRVPSTVQRILRRYVYSSVSTSSALSRTPADSPLSKTPTPANRRRGSSASWPEPANPGSAPDHRDQSPAGSPRTRTGSQRRIARLLGRGVPKRSDEPPGG